MVKVKNRKQVSVDEIQKKRQNQNVKKALNPFEVHINKEKMRVLGKKSKNQHGAPGISRAKALQKRKHTLLPEYKLLNKSNRFLDKRIGEKSKMTEEEKVAARFAAFKAKSHSKQSIFNLSGEVLSHKNHTLSEIEKFEDLKSDDEDSDDEQAGKLDSDFIEGAHFGNGILRNTGREGIKTHKQLIEQLIEESKKRKVEQQRVKEATIELTEKLDSEWKDLVQLVNKKNKKEDEKDQGKAELDDYDKYMRELKFEARGTVSDRLKTEDQIAKEEKEKLEELEAQRLERMRGGDGSNNPKRTHRSADDLDDDFVYESDTEENMLSYDVSGQPNVQIQAEINGKIIGTEKVSENEASESESEEEEIEEDSDSEDSLADLKEGESDESDTENALISNCTEKPDNTEKVGSITKSNKRKFDISDNNVNKKLKIQETINKNNKTKSQIPDNNESNKLKNQEALEGTSAESDELKKAGAELPFTFKLPNSYENLMETLNEKSHNHQKIILERMIKCNHPSLAQGNKEALGILFDYLLQYVNDLFTDIEDASTLQENFKLLRSLMPHIYDLAQLNPENTYNSVLEVIKEKHQEYRKKKKHYPGIEVLVFLKLVSLLFCTSDFRHKVVTPCFVFIEQMLKNCFVKTSEHISYGIFLCTLVLEYTALSNRYLPFTINFLSGILHMAIPKTGVKVIKAPLPFKSLCSDLSLTKSCIRMEVNEKIHIRELMATDFTDRFKVLVLNITFKLLNDFRELFKSYASNVEIFLLIEEYMSQIPLNLYPESVKDQCKMFCDNLSKNKKERKLHYLTLEEKRPKALRLFEPKIEKVYDGKKHKVQSKEKAEREKLVHKLKKATKGAIREIRRDKAFLGRIKINERIRSDKERRDKVNKIFAEAASQQNELNTLDRQKKKK